MFHNGMKELTNYTVRRQILGGDNKITEILFRVDMAQWSKLEAIALFLTNSQQVTSTSL